MRLLSPCSPDRSGGESIAHQSWELIDVDRLMIWVGPSKEWDLAKLLATPLTHCHMSQRNVMEEGRSRANTRSQIDRNVDRKTREDQLD